jgi:hypothetical protein
MKLHDIIPNPDGNPDSDTIDAFMNEIVKAQDLFFEELIEDERLGSPNLANRRILAIILTSYVSMLALYFQNGIFDIDGRFVPVYNLCSVAEMKDVILKINHICGTDIFIHLEEVE